MRHTFGRRIQQHVEWPTLHFWWPRRDWWNRICLWRYRRLRIVCLLSILCWPGAGEFYCPFSLNNRLTNLLIFLQRACNAGCSGFGFPYLHDQSLHTRHWFIWIWDGSPHAHPRSGLLSFGVPSLADSAWRSAGQEHHYPAPGAGAGIPLGARVYDQDAPQEGSLRGCVHQQILRRSHVAGIGSPGCAGQLPPVGSRIQVKPIKLLDILSGFQFRTLKEVFFFLLYLLNIYLKPFGAK